MLSSILKEHNDAQSQRKQQIEKKRLQAVESTHKFSQAILDHLNLDVSEAYLNQKKIDSKLKTLQQNTLTFSKQTQHWSQLLENFNTSLKELGDVENWSRRIEQDMRIISDTLDLCLLNNTQE